MSTNYTDEDLNFAVTLLLCGAESIRNIAQHFQIPKSTLHKKVLLLLICKLIRLSQVTILVYRTRKQSKQLE